MFVGPYRMSAMGQKRTSSGGSIYVRYWGQSGRFGVGLRMSAYSQKRTSEPLRIATKHAHNPHLIAITTTICIDPDELPS